MKPKGTLVEGGLTAAPIKETPIKEGYLSTGHKIDFQIGQPVYLKTDVEQHERMVTGIYLRPNRGITYALTLGTTETVHYAMEISTERDVLKASTN